MSMLEPEDGQSCRRALNSSMRLNVIAKGVSGGLNDGVSLPPSALRRGKFDVSSDRGKPLDLSIINDTFGEGATLYHVLNIHPRADAAEIRRAYLRQGRATLVTAGGIAFTAHDAPRNLDDVPEHARKKFQATSIAYEILSTPQLRSDYDRYGIVYTQSSSSANARERRPKRQNSVRWKPYVEQKIIPDESSHSYPGEPYCSTPENEKQEYGWIESHLRNIDKEAEKFLKGDALETFVDDMFSVKASIGSLIGNIGSRDSTRKTNDVSFADESREDSECSGDNQKLPKKNFLKKLRSNTSLFRTDPQMTVQPYKEERRCSGKDEWSDIPSPRSVTMVDSHREEDMTVSTVHACGLGETFYGLLGRDMMN